VLYGNPGPSPHGWSLESASKSMFHTGTCYKSRAVEVEGRGHLLTLHLGGHEARVRAAVGEERLTAAILDGSFGFVTWNLF